MYSSSPWLQDKCVWSSSVIKKKWLKILILSASHPSYQRHSLRFINECTIGKSIINVLIMQRSQTALAFAIQLFFLEVLQVSHLPDKLPYKNPSSFSHSLLPRLRAESIRSQEFHEHQEVNIIHIAHIFSMTPVFYKTFAYGDLKSSTVESI